MKGSTKYRAYMAFNTDRRLDDLESSHCKQNLKNMKMSWNGHQKRLSKQSIPKHSVSLHNGIQINGIDETSRNYLLQNVFCEMLSSSITVKTYAVILFSFRFFYIFLFGTSASSKNVLYLNFLNC